MKICLLLIDLLPMMIELPLVSRPIWYQSTLTNAWYDKLRIFYQWHQRLIHWSIQQPALDSNSISRGKNRPKLKPVILIATTHVLVVSRSLMNYQSITHDVKYASTLLVKLFSLFFLLSFSIALSPRTLYIEFCYIVTCWMLHVSIEYPLNQEKTSMQCSPDSSTLIYTTAISDIVM